MASGGMASYEVLEWSRWCHLALGPGGADFGLQLILGHRVGKGHQIGRAGFGRNLVRGQLGLNAENVFH